ncbi:deoxycytidylate deaminase [Lentisalinibacter salinarum]|uniref:deoxycytidylate deaminase n=1 Tax=Lentisalinibacter salinarum TaxID=2992239 RepID=UPI00386E4957
MNFHSITAQDTALLKMAWAEAQKTDDPKARVDTRAAVGAVIFRDGRILAKSANRLPPSIRGSYKIRSAIAEERYHFLEHAERCAIHDGALAGESLKGATIYCTRFPCSDCARAIVYSGIERIVVPTGFSKEAGWMQSQRFALQLFRLSDVTVRYLPAADSAEG